MSPLPKFTKSGNLPPGKYPLTWEEFTKIYGTNMHRRTLIVRMGPALNLLKSSGCKTLYMDGSFVTDPKLEPYPSDYDACFVLNEIPEGQQLDRLFQHAQAGSREQLDTFGGEFYGAEIPSVTGDTLLDFFQKDKATNRRYAEPSYS